MDPSRKVLYTCTTSVAKKVKADDDITDVNVTVDHGVTSHEEANSILKDAMKDNGHGWVPFCGEDLYQMASTKRPVRDFFRMPDQYSYETKKPTKTHMFWPLSMLLEIGLLQWRNFCVGSFMV